MPKSPIVEHDAENDVDGVESTINLGPVPLDPPVEMSPKARAIWEETVKELTECGVAARVDALAIVHFCEQRVIWKEARANVRKFGVLITNKRSGTQRANGAINVMNQAHDRLVKMMAEFGMTPMSRAAAGAKAKNARGVQRPAEKVNPFALIAGGKAS